MMGQVSNARGPKCPDKGTLFIVATPIGNLADLSARAQRVLAEVDLIAAEDTRHTGRLLSQFGIKTPQMALHEHNEAEVVELLLARLDEGASVALVSDAGTPLISDPGYRLVRAARASGMTISPVPGPNAAVAALSVAGLPTDRFCFEGFLPPRGKARRERLAALTHEARTMIFYASVHRIREIVQDCADAFGAERPAFLGRELTKLHEQALAATLGELRASLEDGRIPPKGEFVLVVSGAPAAPETARDAAAQAGEDRLLGALAAELPAGRAAAVAAAATGGSRNRLYKRLLALTASSGSAEEG